MENDAAFVEVNELYLDSCICGVGAPCAADCTVVCADPNAMPSAACDACITAIGDNQDLCITDTLDACVASATCAPIIECWGTC